MFHHFLIFHYDIIWFVVYLPIKKHMKANGKDYPMYYGK